MKYEGMMLTDLDGTFLNADGKISQENIDALDFLGQHKIVRAACTGRTLNSAREVIAYDLPFDYLIFSSGAGICSFKDDYIICRHEIPQKYVLPLADYFLDKKLDFSVHFPIPDNHRFYWFSGPVPTSDLESRLFYLKEFAEKGSIEKLKKLSSTTQFLAISKNGTEIIQEMKQIFPELSVIRTTSPINPEFTWIEVFSKRVSKGHGAAWLCNHLGIKHNHTVSIGNDYNDMEMLEWTNDAYAVSNAPKDILARYKTAPHHNENGFAKAIYEWLSEGNRGEHTHRIITGRVNSGKTGSLAEDFKKQNLPIGNADGFACVKVRTADNIHIGYDLVRLTTAEKCEFIRKIQYLPKNWNEAERLNDNYSFCKEGFDFAKRIFAEAQINDVKHFYIDEVAHLESREAGFSQLIKDCLNSGMKLTIVVRESLVEVVIKKYKIDKYRIINLNGMAVE